MTRTRCAEIPAPSGWTFQDCKEDFVSLLRTTRAGRWEIDWKGESLLEDVYLSAGPLPGGAGWGIVAYDPLSGHGPGIRRGSKEGAVGEMVCLAKMQDVRDGDPGKSYCLRLREARETLSECRRALGL
jgi:hypothetical protein